MQGATRQLLRTWSLILGCAVSVLALWHSIGLLPKEGDCLSENHLATCKQDTQELFPSFSTTSSSQPGWSSAIRGFTNLGGVSLET